VVWAFSSGFESFERQDERGKKAYSDHAKRPVEGEKKDRVARIVPGNLPGQHAGQTALQTFAKKFSKHPITSRGGGLEAMRKLAHNLYQTLKIQSNKNQ
jgi:hypothetical protein